MRPASPQICSEAELDAYRAPGADGRLAHTVSALLRQQRATWPRLAEAQARFEAGFLSRLLRVNGFPVRVQHNRDRMMNVAAKVDAASIAERPCFLCPANLPPEQRGVAFGSSFVILCNPAPLFSQHLTIVHAAHVPQRLAGSIDDLLALTEALGPEFAVLYNGPRSGASAPDHLHFQAGAWADLPLSEWMAGTERMAGAEIAAAPAPWGCLALRSADRARAAALLRQALALLAARESAAQAEPGVNLAARWADGRWLIVLFPRRGHRPACYFIEDEQQRIMISPGAADLAGIVIVPRPIDWQRVNAEIVQDIFAEVAIDGAAAAQLAARLAQAMPRFRDGGDR